MREHGTKLAIVALLAVIVGVPFVLRPAAPAQPTSASGDRLVILTPHNEQIRFEMARAFNAWRQSQGLSHVEFDWRTLGGTSDLRRLVLSQIEAAARQGREDQGIGVDLFFGGGDFEHNQLARGITLQRDGRTVRISATVPVELPSGLLEEVFPEPTIGGERLYHPEGYWVGAALSSFGIVYNRDVLAMLKLPQPTTWADLADPRYARWIGLADPGHSGSIAAAYNVILRRLGWNEGWRLLRRIFANARYFTSSASKVPVDVSAGEAAAGMCIDFYGRFQAGAIAAGGESRVGYVDPPFLTTTTADPISVIRGAPHRELANHFVAWLLSRPAQGLWQRRVGTPEGPRRFELRRLPARRDLYTPEEKQFWSDPEVDPFGASRPIPPAMPDFYGMVAPVAHALGIDVHDDLTAAWRAIQRTPEDHPRRRAMLELFDRMPPELELTWPDDLEQHWQDALADEDHRDHEQVVQTLRAFHERLIQRYAGSAGEDRLLEDRLAWTRFFQANYRRVVDLAE